MNLRTIAPLAALSALSLSAVAAPQPATQDVGATAVAGGLQAGLDAIQLDHIKGDIFFLASDEMGGRDSPSPEQRIAARYIRDRLTAMGWQHGTEDGYLHTYTLPATKLDLEATKLVVKVGGETLELKVGEGYFIDARAGGKRSISGGAVYVGDLSDIEPEDFKLKGRWAVGEATRGVSRKRREALADAGAIGVVVLPEEGAEKTVAETFARTFQRMTMSSRRAPRASSFGYVHLTEETTARIGQHLGELEVGMVLPLEGAETCAYHEDVDELENVMGIWPGSDPKLRDEVIILSAHYDHVGKRENGDIYNGADDNGSGTTGLLSLCEALASYGPMRRTIMLQWVSAEEKGLLGSAAWTQDPWLPEGMRPVCNVNIDMIGRNAPDKLNITPTSEHEEYSWLTRVAEKHAPDEGFPKLGSADPYYQRSDHYNYRKHLNIPVAFLFADVHEDYHKPTDTPDKIDLGKIQRVSRLVLRMLDDLQADKLGG